MALMLLVALLCACRALQLSASLKERHIIGIDASDLGWRPGVWPQDAHVVIDGRQVFMTKRRAVSVDEPSGELLYVEYSAAAGALEVQVFND